MSIEDLIKKIEQAIQYSGYPLEQRIGYCLLERGWHPFHSELYFDPTSGKQRELDILAYKIINERRIELRISCKRSVSKPWIVFTEDQTRFLKMPSSLKVIPVSDDWQRYERIGKALSGLPFFSHDRRVINYSAFHGKEFSNDVRTVIRDSLYSALSSVYHRIYPRWLLFDPRGTIFFFITVFDGLFFESFYDHTSGKDIVREIDYAQWQAPLHLERPVESIPDQNGNMVPLSHVLYYFSEWFKVEIIKWSYFPEYLKTLETTFANIGPSDIALFGSPWTNENFPSTVSAMPVFHQKAKKHGEATKSKKGMKGRKP